MSDAARGAASPSEAAGGAGRAGAEPAAAPGKLGEPSTPRPCGACHKCGAQVKDASRVLVCDTCGCRYHTFDCGSRIYCAGVTVGPEAACPRCTGLCACGGGKVLCHTAAQRQKRKEAGAASLRRKRQVVAKASPRGTATVKGSGSGGAVGTPSASVSGGDTSGIASMHARRIKAEHGTPVSGAAAFAGLAGLAALAGAVSEPQRPSAAAPPTAAGLVQAAQPPANAFCMQIASFYALQTELLLFKTRAAQLEAENATLRRLLHGQGSTQQQQQQVPAVTPPQQQGAQPAALQLVAPPPLPSSAAAAWAAQPQLQNAANITSAINAALATQGGGGFNPATGGSGEMMSFAQNLPLFIALAQQQQRGVAAAAAPAS